MRRHAINKSDESDEGRASRQSSGTQHTKARRCVAVAAPARRRQPSTVPRAALLGFFACVASLLLACSDTARTADPNVTQMELQNNLAAAIEKKSGAGDAPLTVEMKSVAAFPWDRLYVFTPYTPLENVRRALGREWPQAARTRIDARDDINLLVFTRGGEVVQFLEYPRRRGDFSKIDQPAGFKPEEAVFEVRTEDRGEPWLTLYPVRPRK